MLLKTLLQKSLNKKKFQMSLSQKNKIEKLFKTYIWLFSKMYLYSIWFKFLTNHHFYTERIILPVQFHKP